MRAATLKPVFSPKLAGGAFTLLMMLLVMLLVAGCPGPNLPDPVVERVVPAFAFNGDEETVTVIGRNFLPEVAVDAIDGDADVNRTFVGWLVGPLADAGGTVVLMRPVTAVSLIDGEHLTATVPPGLPKGLYDLIVEGPSGRRGSLARAFTVTDTEAAQLTLQTDRVVYSITEPASIKVSLVDLGGDLVPIPFEVAVVGVHDALQLPITHEPGTLRDAVPTPDGDGIRGTIEGGSATVTLRSAQPGSVTVRVSPWDPASIVVGDTLYITFQPGDDLRVRLTLGGPVNPTPEFEAGTPFPLTAELVDQYGNPVGVPALVTLGTVCSGFIKTVLLDGPTEVWVEPRFMTNSDCSLDRVEVLAGQGPPGSSDVFTVRAGPPDHFEVTAAPLANVAGGTLYIVVDPVDRFGNRADWEGIITLIDSVSGLQSAECIDLVLFRMCTAMVTVASPQQTVFVSGDDGLLGISNTYAVSADPVPVLLDARLTGPMVAGASHPFEVSAHDAWNNEIAAEVFGVGGYVLTDPLGELSCTEAGAGPTGTAAFDCELYTSRTGATINAELPAFGVNDSTDAFEVFNGPLAAVAFSHPSTATAGVTSVVTLSAFDAWGNPYFVQTDPTVALWDDWDSYTVASATFGTDATTLAGGHFTRAGQTHLHAGQGGITFGDSGTITVGPAQTSGLSLTPDGPFGWVGEPFGLRVEGVDVFGNRTDLLGLATLTSETGAGLPLDLSLVNGVGTANYVFTQPSFVDTLRGSLGAFEGTVEVPVSNRCPGPAPMGPLPMLDFGNGSTDGLACVNALGEATLVADFGGSTPGGAALTGFAVGAVGGPVVVDTVGTVAITLEGIGAHAVRGLVVDAVGCGADVAGVAWLGPDDGSPVGPITVTASVSELSVVDLATITLSDAVDCAGDPAAAREVLVRTTAGTVDGTPTGAGLVTALDVNGNGALQLTTAGALAQGVAEVHVTVPSPTPATTAAAGFLALPVTDDSIRPIVVQQVPAGYTVALVGQITLTFSEPLLPGSVVPGNFTVAGPSAVTVSSVDYVAGTTTVDVNLSPAADSALGGYTIAVNQSVRDVAGNRLAGDFGVVAAPYLGGFGAAGIAPAAVSCGPFVPFALMVRPDGDDGPGPEAEVLTIGLTSAQAPAWWVVEARDGLGSLVHQDWFRPLGPIDTVAWHARDLQGFIVANGTYRVSVRPDDGLGQRGTGCEVQVTVDNRLGRTP